ncbi:DUF2207 domain-containing protein [Domibacillus aminovorans]|uniref:DUF2207 domain-containing protein n=1 Tax=Domibacillus aminovorans TaxID=29332 RepID=A0A177L5N4_9BACI|nr:DUF2207 domain-containing protein [Domibacillus aminovorans]OAH60565.1 hypothetical protein AWH49_15630 [Domibacillus aminovorans]
MKKQLAFFVLFLFLFAPSVHARSYSMDEVNIRTWIQPDGDVLVNEIFHYTFNGDYERVRRSIHKVGHDGVEYFEAYELTNTSAEPGFVSQNDLRALPVEQEDNTFYAALPTANTSKSVFYIYELKNAVHSYDTYSDLTIPFFGTDGNHDETLENVTIDIVFPEEIEPSQYYAFFHDRLGMVEEKGSEVVRFTTPASMLYSLTEVRVLFPSSMMTGQTKRAEPMTITEAVDAENTLAQSFYKKEEQKDNLEILLMVLSAAVFAGAIAVMFVRFHGGRSDSSSLIHHDPLYLYMIDRAGKTDHYAFLAGLYSLVEKGFASVQVSRTHGRFYKDPDSPNNTLHFTLTGDRKRLSDCEKKLVMIFFKRRNTFTVHDLAGATKNEKTRNTTLRNYQKKVQTFKQREQEWVDNVIDEMKEDGVMSDRLPRFLKGWVLLAVFGLMLYTYVIDSLEMSTMIVYGTIGLVLMITIWRKPKKRWPAPIFFTGSALGAAMLYDVDAALWLVLFILLSAVLYFLTPRFLLSSEAAVVKADSRQFRIQRNMPNSDIEKWTVRSLILRAKKPVSHKMLDTELAAVAPLTFLILSDEEPVRYVSETWKWSIPRGSSSSSSDSGGDFFGDSGSGGDSGGGDGGGGD